MEKQVGGGVSNKIGRRREEQDEDVASGFGQYASDFHGAHSAGALQTGRPDPDEG